MSRFMANQQELMNFLVSVEYSHPALAEKMHDDILTVSIFAMGADKTGGQNAADRLRQKALNLPELHSRMLEFTLTDMGF